MDDNTSTGCRSRCGLIVTTIVFALATILVTGRLVSRFVILKKGALDDWVMIVAWVSTDFPFYRTLQRIEDLVLMCDASSLFPLASRSRSTMLRAKD
jgi:hypothetical protein